MLKLLAEIIGLIFIMIFVIFIAAYTDGYRINLTPSMPEGLYQIIPTHKYHRNDLVIICLPTKLAQSAHMRGYMVYGSCDNGYEPVIKKIIAVPNDKVIMNTNGITVNGEYYDYKKSQVDNLDRYLNPKKATNEMHGYLLIGANLKDLGDSRYFEVIKVKYLIARVGGKYIF
ncbi:conjugative transfer signal peptidase TraF [Francisella sp. SYW-9]|uniref:conjugative transfer signal peptidase TraF n=1 Tax=Francisella sp. SYW-9 TaxID=2610888 RepID=UPI00123E1F87|nr:conjugative transfer signal peptidase TraF [Francisella sp. SYW-9]